jgi:hypothetical protein
MSDDRQDQLDRADDERADEDVEAHSLDRPVDAPHAIEEPPDVEGHGFHPSPVDPKPVD